MARCIISYGFDGATGEERCTVKNPTTNQRMVLTREDIERIVAARDEYDREKRHRGYPVKG